jgi:hypothetical protein
MREKIKDVIIIGGPLLIGLSALKQVVYYRHFGLNISEYLEISELLVGFFDDIFTFILCSIIGGFIEFVRTSRNELDEMQSLENEINIAKNFFVRLYKHFKLYSFGFWSIVFLGLLDLLILVLHDEHSHQVLQLFFFTLVLMILTFVWTEAKLKLRKVFEIKVASKIDAVIKLTSTFLICFIFFTHLEIEAVQISKKYIDTEVYFTINNKEFKYKSDSTFYYIGKTKDFVFFYDELKEHTEIIPFNYVNRLIIKRKKDFPLLGL